MQTKILKIIAYLFMLIALCLNINAQVKTKIFYNDVPLSYKSLLAQVSTTHKIEAPPEFYKLWLKKKLLKI